VSPQKPKIKQEIKKRKLKPEELNETTKQPSVIAPIFQKKPPKNKEAQKAKKAVSKLVIEKAFGN
jgi:hypothetical protein